ncbi:MAG: Lon protease-like protein [Arenicella sp.]|jgi:Lon protease-like protein
MLPLFPLGTIVFPGENLNLHIFEPRYRQLIHDCETEFVNFGISAFLDNQIKEYGTEIELMEITNRYPDGKLDVKTKGKRLYKMSDFKNPMRGKLYAGAKVEYIELEEDDAIFSERILLVEQIYKLYEILNVQADISAELEFLSFKVGHKVGLSIQQEYQLLTLSSESARINFILDHLTRSIPILKGAEDTKSKIQMNGHFRNYDPLDFK